MTTRFLIPVMLFLAHCATGRITIVNRDAAPASLTARVGSATQPLEGELVRFAMARPVDVFIARDPKTGLTFHRVLVVGARPFEESVQWMERFLEERRFVEHGGRIYAFGGQSIVLIEDSAETSASLRAAESASQPWLTAHPEKIDPNHVHMHRFVEYDQRVSGGFFHGTVTSQPLSPHLRDVVREGDHWLVTMQSPTGSIATLVINDRDELVDVNLSYVRCPAFPALASAARGLLPCSPQ